MFIVNAAELTQDEQDKLTKQITFSLQQQIQALQKSNNDLYKDVPNETIEELQEKYPAIKNKLEQYKKKKNNS